MGTPSYIIQPNMKTKTVKKFIAKSSFFLLNSLRKKTEVWCNDINKVWKELVNHLKKTVKQAYKVAQSKSS